MIVQNFGLNLIPDSAPVVVHVDQYDHGTGRLRISLYEGDVPYEPSGTAQIQGKKPDGRGFLYNASLSGNVVTANLEEQMTAVAGKVLAQVIVTETSGRTGSFKFILDVQASALPSDTDMSESDYQAIEELIEEAQEVAQEIAEDRTAAENAATSAGNSAEDSEAWAQGTRAGIPVEPTDPTYKHNAEYWAHQAESAASGVSKFNGRSGSVLPMAGDYDSKKILLASTLHIGGETQDDVQEALEALSDGSGHTILNGLGQEMPQRSNLQFSGGLTTSDDSTNGKTVVSDGVWTTPVSCLVGDTTCTITNSAIHTTSTIRACSETSSGEPVGYKKIVATEGQAVITFASALTEAANVKLNVLNV